VPIPAQAAKKAAASGMLSMNQIISFLGFACWRAMGRPALEQF
jgi:hypothetical protein